MVVVDPCKGRDAMLIENKIKPVGFLFSERENTFMGDILNEVVLRMN